MSQYRLRGFQYLLPEIVFVISTRLNRLASNKDLKLELLDNYSAISSSFAMLWRCSVLARRS